MVKDVGLLKLKINTAARGLQGLKDRPSFDKYTGALAAWRTRPPTPLTLL